MKTLFAGHLITFLLIIFLTITFHTAIDYYSSYREIPRLLTQVRTDFITRRLENFYSRRGSWDGLEEELSWLDSGEPEDASLFRVVVRDGSGRTLYNSFSRLTRWEGLPLVTGCRSLIYDSQGNEVGSVTAYIGKAYLTGETLSYLTGSLRQRLVWGITALSAVSLLAWLFTRRLTGPIMRLTEGMEQISRGIRTESLSLGGSDELDRMGRAFNDMAEALDVQKNLRKRLVGDISHDLGTPLNRIRLEARAIADGLTTRVEGTERIIEEVDKLKNLTADLDWLADTDSGAFRLNLKETDLASLIREEAGRWVLKGKIRNIKLETRILLPEGFRFSLDPNRFGQALGNLLDNSLKYSSAGGTVIISVFLENRRIYLTVEDRGPGIAEKDLPHIFDRFYRADLSRTDGSRGLGLSIVKRIVELHGGSISAYSPPGQGSRFVLSFPL